MKREKNVSWELFREVESPIFHQTSHFIRNSPSLFRVYDGLMNVDMKTTQKHQMRSDWLKLFGSIW